ncbi:MAG TPA: CehA/McbA family metallohydrolase [Mycobacteriales bacterium]|nr:CehA/McbA family metallohydrolase [Mycobacteriales bacterium]
MPNRRITAVVLTLTTAAAVPAAAGVSTAHPASTQPRPAAQAAGAAGFWVAGDLHVHTIYGHDTCITPTTAWDPSSTSRDARRACADPYTVGFAPAQRLQEALDRGLGFVAITDHNNVVNQTEPDVVAWERTHPAFVAVPGYENSQPGHVQMLGATACYGNAGRIDGSTIECDQAITDKSAAGETALADGLRADGGVFQVNHPSDGNWPGTFGYSVVPDTIEVWNIGPWAYQHPFPASNDNNFSLQWYDGFLRQPGLPEIGVTGGSDSHWVTTDGIQGVGDPTTWVFVHKLSIDGVLDGLRQHHTFVSALPPAEQGPQLFLEADRNNDGSFDAIAGDEVGSDAAYRVRTVGAVPGSVLRIVTDTGSVEVPMGAATSYEFVPGRDGIPAASIYVRAELLAPDARAQRTTGCDPAVGSQTTVCRDDLAMESLSSPIFIR